MKLFNYQAFIGMMCLLLSSAFLLAQDATLKGTVTDKDSGAALAFVNISAQVGGNTKGAQTDYDGNYSFTLPAGKHTIKFSFIGYAEQKVQMVLEGGEATILNIELSEEEELLDQVVITATKFEQRLGEQTVSLEVVKPDLLENSNLPSVDQALEKVPGVDVIDGQANIRGGSGYSYGAGSRVMLLMDDMPILTADAGFPNWDFLPVENIGQMEVVKGATSALYGSSAMNGIVNVRTAYPTSEPFTKATAFVGLYQNPRNSVTDSSIVNFDEEGVALDTVPYNKNWWGNQQPIESGFSFAHRQKFGQFDLVLGSNFYLRDSWRETIYERRGRIMANTRYRFLTVPGLSVGLNTNLSVSRSSSFLLWNGDEADLYRIWTATPTINNQGLKLSVDPFVEYLDADRGMKHKLSGRYYRNDNITDTDQSTKSGFYYGEYQFQKRFEDISLNITAGVAASLATVNAELYNGEYWSSNYAGYLQLDKKFFDRLNVSLGARFEQNAIGGEVRTDTMINGATQTILREAPTSNEGKPVFRSGINYQLADYTYLRASFGQAYRFPTIAEKFIQTDLGGITELNGLTLPNGIPIGIFPNPNLKSETGWSAEIGLKQGFKISNWRGFIDVAGFINRYNDMMEFTFGVDSTFRPLVPIIWPALDTFIVQVPANTEAGIGFQSVNIGNTRILGVDMSIAGQGELFGLPTTALIGYTFTDPRFQSLGRLERTNSSVNYDSDGNLLPEEKHTNILKYRFQHTVKADIESQIKKASLGIGIRYYSFMKNIDESFNRFLPGIKEFREENNGGTTVIDARASYNFGNGSNLAFICKNLLNLEYALRPGVIDAPRSFTVKYSHEF